MTQFNQENINPTYSDYPEDNSDYQAKLTQKVDKLGNFSLNMLRSLVLWRLIGYGFLVLFALDVVAIVVPPNFLNPQWEFQILGEIVERVAIPFIALLLIFFGGNYLRKGWEYLVLTSLSWLSLIVGVLFILAVPLGVINTIRIDTQATTRLTEQTNQRLEILKQVETKLKDVNSREEMQVLISQLSNNNAPIIENDQQLTEAKQRLGEFITSSRNQLSTQTDLANNQRRKSLIKQSVKWNLGALISGILFVMTWQMTKWARQKVE
ncbi:hypothetical protein H6G11_15060 [Cyanobacterium aponinum FACHB-4101]|uniref:HpsJ-like protein, cyanoexosortase A-associated n=1 Tax=Cyanobacterium aponinum TaxID=379064 RepID=UPI001681094A|nr:HpsJ family protein [Cyanobacterium aponinum]MBD2395567.1 hypothetical protein [Cyanobacterium aponinum FACHB-4101]